MDVGGKECVCDIFAYALDIAHENLHRVQKVQANKLDPRINPRDLWWCTRSYDDLGPEVYPSQYVYLSGHGRSQIFE